MVPATFIRVEVLLLHRGLSSNEFFLPSHFPYSGCEDETHP